MILYIRSMGASFIRGIEEARVQSPPLMGHATGDRTIRRKKADHTQAAQPTLIPPAPVQPPAIKSDFQIIWECPNCGQTFFGQHPPDLCDYCQDFTTWRRIEAHP